ncbi:hypothetical protein [Nocardia wallacei]|uniref:hypothetical protein n=1 Tax=Nocardia wallacei TaxID=480035 RepID=UPI00245839E7|nr:hypothetical protein [Nocardia wallacei]
MTGPNPPHDREQPDQGGQPNETVQWWSTPPAHTSPETPVTGTEPTVLGGGRQGPVTGTDPTVLGAGFDSYLGNAQPPSQPYGQQSQPQYPQQSAPQYQQQAQGGYPPPPPYGNQPYGQQPYPGRPYPPPKKGSAAPWIIGGVVGLVVIIAAVVGVVALASRDSGGGGGSLTGTDSKVDGNYAMTNVTDACTLVDTTVLRKWAPTPDGTPEHTERQPDSTLGGGSLECRASYTGAGKYGDDGSDLDFEADFQSEYGTPDFNNWKDYDTQTTGSGRSSGIITGLGQDAYYAIYEQSYSSFVTLDYTCAVLDSNLSAKVKLSIDTPTATNKDEVGTACKDQLKKALTALHK